MPALRPFVLLPAVLLLTACGSDDSLMPSPPLPDSELALTVYQTGFERPVQITHAGDGSDRLFVVEQAGIVRVIEADTVQPEPFLDITAIVHDGGSEQGLLSIAFPPEFDADNGHFYAFYTRSADAQREIEDGDTLVSRFHLDAGSADPDSEEILLVVAQPQSNHNGGQLAFGPDGNLYVGLGDGGGSGDPEAHGQNVTTLLGSILRIKVESVPASFDYQVPPDNPLVGMPGRDEIWARGLRNPWRFSFDRATGDLYIGDVGQARREEINFHPPAPVSGGINYGWNLMEGSLCFEPPDGCNRSGLELPVTEYGHVGTTGCTGAVTGGFVYRGEAFPALHGTYLHGDFCTGTIRGFEVNPDGAVDDRILHESGLAISTFGEDEAGELYLADYGSGNLYHIVLD